MTDIKKIPMISSEIGGLWQSYMADTMIVCILKYYLNNVECEETRTLLQQTFDLSTQHIKEITDMFILEGLPIPDGYTDKDVNINAPRLFTDPFYLHYLSFMARASMHNYTLILNQIARSDIRAFFSKRIYEYIDLYNTTTDLRLSKGIFIRAPRVEVPKEIQYVKSNSFLIDYFGEKRPMIANEITHVFGMIFARIIGRAISTAFGQVSREKKHSEYFFEGKEITSKHISELMLVLTKEDIPIPSTSDSFVTDSKIPPFSEKLMLAHMTILTSSGISSLGMAVAETMRSDLQHTYMKYMNGDRNYAKIGTNILIDNNWMEQPPQGINHENLVGV
jgi:hypothetical protein